MSRLAEINKKIEELEVELAICKKEDKWSHRVEAITKKIWQLEDELYEISENSMSFWDDDNEE